MKGKILDLQISAVPVGNGCCGSFYVRPSFEVTLTGTIHLEPDVNPMRFNEAVVKALDEALTGKKAVSESQRVKELESELAKAKAQNDFLRTSFKEWRKSTGVVGKQFRDLVTIMEDDK